MSRQEICIDPRDYGWSELDEAHIHQALEKLLDLRLELSPMHAARLMEIVDHLRDAAS